MGCPKFRRECVPATPGGGGGDVKVKFKSVTGASHFLKEKKKEEKK
jgi:hypothetical protein